MRARLAEILVLVIDRLLDDPQALEDFDGMVDALVERGVTAGEARQALAWLLSALREGQGGEETGRWERAATCSTGTIGPLSAWMRRGSSSSSGSWACWTTYWWSRSSSVRTTVETLPWDGTSFVRSLPRSCSTPPP
jgi:hypothetical protein